MDKKLTVSATGDALFVADIPKEYYEGDFKAVSEFINSCQIKITNLETNVEKFGDFPNAYSGGTWLNTEPEVFDHLTKFGFNYYGTANNHCLDYSYHGLLSTIDELDKRNLAHSGTGRSLAEASAPAIVKAGDKKVAIFAITTTFETASKAGEETKLQKARPGVNYVGHETFYPIDKEGVEQLKNIAKTTRVNGHRELSIQGGFVLPDPDGIYNFGGIKFCYDGSKKKTECNKADKERVINAIKQAKKEYDYVLVLIHCHDIKTDRHQDAPDYLEELSHACIDAGASAMIGGGTHQLRAIEIYKGCPIFYSLGDFIYQGMRVPILPADFMTKYGLDINATAMDGLMKRSQNGKIGLQAKKCNFMTVIPKMTFDGETLTDLTMMPVVAGFDKAGKLNGLPYFAKGQEAEDIFNELVNLSTPYQTNLEMKDGFIKLKF